MTWHRVPLGYLVRFGNGQDAKDVINPEGEYPVYGSGGKFATTSSYLHDGEAVLFGRKGTIDKPRYVNGRFWTIDTAYYAVSRGHIDTKFMYYWSTTIPFDTLMTNTARPSMTSSDLGRLPVALPPFGTQRSIADHLDHETAKMDAMCADLDELIVELNDRRHSLASREFSSFSSESPLGLHCRVFNGSTPSRSNSDYWSETGFPWLNSSVVNTSPVVASSGFVSDLALKECHLPTTLPGDVLMGITGQGRTRGMVALSGIEATLSQHLVAIRPGREFIPDFLRYALDLQYESIRFMSEGAGSTKGAITIEMTQRLRVPLPPLDEQRRTVARLDAESAKIDAMITDALNLKELTAERRSALITDVVTGRKEI